MQSFMKTYNKDDCAPASDYIQVFTNGENGIVEKRSDAEEFNKRQYSNLLEISTKLLLDKCKSFTQGVLEARAE